MGSAGALARAEGAGLMGSGGASGRLFPESATGNEADLLTL